MANRLANVTIDECGLVLAQLGGLAHRATYDLCKRAGRPLAHSALALRHCKQSGEDAVRFGER